MEASVFTRIIQGQIPCHKVYEDELTFAFLDIHPIQPGHVLIVPKTQVASLWDLDTNTYQAVMRTTKEIAGRIRRAFPAASHVAMQVEGLEVPHAHVKIYPFSTSDEFLARPNLDLEPDHQALATIANMLMV
jgi:histidine triad (HIT) family protein